MFPAMQAWAASVSDGVSHDVQSRIPGRPGGGGRLKKKPGAQLLKMVMVMPKSAAMPAKRSPTLSSVPKYRARRWARPAAKVSVNSSPPVL